jgi:hypothetical protein
MATESVWNELFNQETDGNAWWKYAVYYSVSIGGIDFASLCNFSIGFCNCYDNVIMFVFHLFIQIIQTLDLIGRR